MVEARPVGRRWFVYLIIGEGSPIIKIGVSRDPFQRLAELQFHSPNKLSVAYSLRLPDREMAYRCERLMHETFQDRRQHGEWFLVPFQEAAEALLWISEEVRKTPAKTNALVYDLDAIRIRPRAQPVEHRRQPAEILAMKLEAERAKVAMLEAQVRDLQRRLDAEAEERQALNQRLLGPPEAPAAPARAWWQRWRGR